MLHNFFFNRHGNVIIYSYFQYIAYIQRAVVRYFLIKFRIRWSKDEYSLWYRKKVNKRSSNYSFIKMKYLHIRIFESIPVFLLLTRTQQVSRRGSGNISASIERGYKIISHLLLQILLSAIDRDNIFYNGSTSKNDLRLIRLRNRIVFPPRSLFRFVFCCSMPI